MPLSTDITVPKGQTPVFPKKCLVCHGSPDSSVQVARNGQNPFLVFFVPFLWFFGWERVTVPVCGKCKWRFRLQRWGRELVIVVLIFIAVWLIMPHFKGWNPLTRKVVGGALVLLVMLPVLAGDVWWPRYFDTTVRGDVVDYEFASAEYAHEFYLLNGGEDPDEAARREWSELKDRLMEQTLGKEHNMVMHAIIPYAVGGGLDLYYYPNGIPGTGIATKELSELPDQGSSNRRFQTYELVMFTKLPLSLDDAKNEETPFGRVHMRINAILNRIAPYSAQASLNPDETSEFPQEMEKLGGACLIFDGYGLHNEGVAVNFGLLLIMEIHRSEMNYAREHGAAALFHLLKQAGHYPYSDMDREAVV